MVFFIIGGLFLVAGIVFFFLRKSLEKKIFQIKATETKKVSELETMCKEIAGEVGGGGYHEICEVKGKITSDNPIVSEIAKKPCVYYEMKVTRKWEETYYEKDSDGNRRRKTRTGHDTVASNKQSMEFWIDDGSGKIKISPDKADLETVKVVDQFQPGEQASSNTLSFMGVTFNISGFSGGRRTIGYHYEEKILPLNRPAYILGEASDSSGELKIKAPVEKGKKFIISLKSEEEILAGSAKKSKLYNILFISGIAIGAILIVLGAVK